MKILPEQELKTIQQSIKYEKVKFSNDVDHNITNDDSMDLVDDQIHIQYDDDEDNMFGFDDNDGEQQQSKNRSDDDESDESEDSDLDYCRLVGGGFDEINIEDEERFDKYFDELEKFQDAYQPLESYFNESFKKWLRIR